MPSCVLARCDDEEERMEVMPGSEQTRQEADVGIRTVVAANNMGSKSDVGHLPHGDSYAA